MKVRQKIAREYESRYEKDLVDVLKSELTGSMEELIVALMEPPVDFLCHQLRKAMKGIGARKHVLTEVLIVSSNETIREIKNAYHRLYSHKLEKDIRSETTGDYQRFLLALHAATRDESRHTDHNQAVQDAQSISDGLKSKRNTAIDDLVDVLTSQNYYQLRLFFHEFERSAGQAIEKSIDAETSGDIREALLALVGRSRNLTSYLAAQLNKSMEGLGTRDTDLIRLIVSRSEVDLLDVADQFIFLYGKTLEEAISGDCSGTYRD
ncbi:annexin, partial [Aphelenchoides avenae]